MPCLGRLGQGRKEDLSLSDNQQAWLSVEQREGLRLVKQFPNSETIIALLASHAEADRREAELREQVSFWINAANAAKVDAGYFQELREQLAKQEQVWRCFHCGFEATDSAQATAHFGERDDADLNRQSKLRRDVEQENERLREALVEAKCVMDHFGNLLNSYDVVDEIEQDTGVSNERVFAAFKLVDEALAATLPAKEGK